MLRWLFPKPDYVPYIKSILLAKTTDSYLGTTVGTEYASGGDRNNAYLGATRLSSLFPQESCTVRKSRWAGSLLSRCRLLYLL